MEIPNFATKKELFDFLVTNKDKIITAKKAVMKAGDNVPFFDISVAGVPVQKAFISKAANVDEVKVIAIINTTNLMDSHKDVHIPGIWNKSLKENRSILHLQEHQMKFDHIIAEGEDLKVYTKSFNWKDLGYDFAGKTEALVFESTVKRETNPFMFKRYEQKKVKNHSVGMHYVKIALAINDDDYGAEKEVWDKYYPEIANKEAAEASGYFWAVKEAKAIEGSAVPIGSNFATPTLEPKDFTPENTINEPSVDTQKFRELLINELKSIKL